MISIVTLAMFLAQQVSAPAPVPAAPRVEGSVVNALNGEPVRKATVILRAHDEEHGLSYADETDSNGHFSIPGVEPGEYAIIADHTGFIVRTAGATGAPPPNIKVEQGQPVPA